MAKVTVKTIAEKRAEMERELERLGAFATILAKLEDHISYEFGIIQHDEDGNIIEDAETGEWVYDFPKEGDWNYERYVAFKDAVDEIKALV